MKNYVRLAAVTAAVMLALTACGGNSAQTETEAQTAAEEYPEMGTVTKLGNYTGVKLTAGSTVVTDEEVEETIQGILDANPEYVEVDRAAKEGDRVNIDFVGLMDGEEFEGGSSENYYLELGSGSFIDGFEDGLIGAKAGEERSLELTFPEDYYADLAGKEVVFNVTVNSVEQIIPAVLDDEFVQKMSEFDTVDEFRQDIVDVLTEYKEELAETQLQRDALQAVTDTSEFDLNPDYLEQNLQYNTEYIEYMASMYGMTLEEFVNYGYGMTMEEFDDYCRDMINDQMKQSLVVDAIAEKENLQLTEEDLQYTADKLYEDLDSLKESDPEYLEANAIAFKVADFIIEKADITEEAPAVTEQDDEDTES